MAEGIATILLVEDDESLRRIIAGHLRGRGFRVEEANSAEDAVGSLEDGLRPAVVLLDLNLPKKDGREVLQEIKNDDTLKRIPVVILTTSKAEEDVLKTYNLHANCYVTKPVDLEKFIVVVKSIDVFWLTVVTLPPNGH